VKANIDLSNVTINTRSGDFNATSLAHVINAEVINTLVLQTWFDRAGTDTECRPVLSQLTRGSKARRESTLVFCVNIAHVVNLTNTFRKAGVDARFLHSKTPPQERKKLLDEFRTGRFPVLINCGT
jgi:ATP-dependent helicase IRC3